MKLGLLTALYADARLPAPRDDTEAGDANASSGTLTDWVFRADQVCIQAKQTRASFKRQAPRATRRLACIHIDISGDGETFNNPDKLIPDYNSYNYIMIIIDDVIYFC